MHPPDGVGAGAGAPFFFPPPGVKRGQNNFASGGGKGWNKNASCGRSGAKIVGGPVQAYFWILPRNIIFLVAGGLVGLSYVRHAPLPLHITHFLTRSYIYGRYRLCASVPYMVYAHGGTIYDTTSTINGHPRCAPHDTTRKAQRGRPIEFPCTCSKEKKGTMWGTGGG